MAEVSDALWLLPRPWHNGFGLGEILGLAFLQ
jgi:hypothetical protein